MKGLRPFKCIAFASILGSAMILPSLSMAASILGGSIFVSNPGEVFATFQGSDASYSSTLYLGGTAIFNNKTTSVGTTISLGTFTAGTELVFNINVHNTGHSFFTGNGLLNNDGVAHALVDNMFSETETWVGFEDLYGGGDRDYNDLQFSFTNVLGESPGEGLGDPTGGSGGDPTDGSGGDPTGGSGGDPTGGSGNDPPIPTPEPSTI
ncbi:MAG: DUF4114 domain-containing protein, partial [Nitrospirales bacterium]